MKIYMLKIFFIFFCLFCIEKVNAQILTFEFFGIVGNETSIISNFNDPNIANSTIYRGLGLTASVNGDRFNATNWSLVSIDNAIAGNNYMEFTITVRNSIENHRNS